MNSTRPLVVSGRLEPERLAAPALPSDEHDIPRSVMCPMCHTSARVTQDAIEAGVDWRCIRCGQHWDGARLAKVAAYAEWAGEHARTAMRNRAADHVQAPQTERSWRAESGNAVPSIARPGGRS